MRVFLQIVAFSWQTDRSGRPVLTKGKRPTTEAISTIMHPLTFWTLSANNSCMLWFLHQKSLLNFVLQVLQVKYAQPENANGLDQILKALETKKMECTKER